MKLKKFFAGVLAAAMMLTVGATAAFATTGSGSSTNSFGKNEGEIALTDSLTLTKHYEVVKGKAPLRSFKFDISYVGSKDLETGKTFTAPSSFDQVEAVFTKDSGQNGTETGLAVGNYSATFNIPMSALGLGSFNGTGKFAYKISEVDDHQPGVTYNTDGGNLYLIVTVTHKTTGDKHEIVPNEYNYSAALYRTNGDVNSVDQATAGTKVEAKDAFHNTYGDNDEDKVNAVELKKIVHGNFADLGKEFTFDVIFNKGDADKAYGPIMLTNADNVSIKVGKQEFSGNELAYGTTYTVTLKHQQSVTFGNLPQGITYTMTENDKDSTGKVDGVYDVSGEAEDTVTMGNEDKAVTIENTNQASPDMGVVLDNAPYIAMLAIVVIGGVALMLNKRRRDEE